MNNAFPENIYLFRVSKRNTTKKMSNMFKVNSKDTRMTSTSLTSLWCLYC